MRQRADYLTEMTWHIAQLYRYAGRKNFKLAVRPNGSTDIAYEGLRLYVSPEFALELSEITGHAIIPGFFRNVFELFPWIQFLDYTKNPTRFDRALPSNYHLTFSRSETNESVCRDLLARGINVAVVFDKLPTSWESFPVINGDKHDLRHLDQKGGFVVGLTPKGNKAKRDRNGFVVRNYGEVVT